MLHNLGLIREGIGRAMLRALRIPNLRDDYILVRTEADAINPTDWTTLDAKGDDGTIVGCDYSGVVEEVGPDVTRDFKKGDRIAGFAHGGISPTMQIQKTALSPDNIAVKGDLQMHVPDNVSFETAASVGVGIATLGYGLYEVLQLPRPGSSVYGNGDPILIYGGSTATGTLAIQFAKMSGMKVITTSSPKHFGLMKDRGADLIYDNHIPNIGEKIRANTNGKLAKVFDTVSTETTAKICADALGAEGGIICNLLDSKWPRADVRSVFFLGWKPHPQRVEPGGLSGIIDGMQQMRLGRVSGEKLVYRVVETDFS